MSSAQIPAGEDADQLVQWGGAPAEPTPSADGDRLWSIKDVGRYLDVPVATIYQWRVRGEGPRATRMGKHLRFETEVVRTWVGEHREGA